MIKLKLTVPARWRRAEDAPSAWRAPANPAYGPTAISLSGAFATGYINGAYDLNAAVADATFSSAGFRMFLYGALADMDAVFRAGVAQRQENRRTAAVARAERISRRSARNQHAAAYAATALTEETAPRILATMFARALHASDDDAPTGLMPAITA